MYPEGLWNNNAYKPTQSGEYVSADQLKSTILGLIANFTRILTTKHYNIATIFVDQETRFIFAHFQTTDISDGTLKTN